MKNRIRMICEVWHNELKYTLRDQGVLIFFILLPLGYPLVYSWIYNNEVVREVPVAVVDNSRSSGSRAFVQQCDASPDVRVAARVASMDEAKLLMSKGEVYGIYCIPSDFALRLSRMEQTTVSVYCSMSLMLYYKAVFQTASNVASAMNGRLQIALAGNQTAREDELTAHPLTIDEVPVFNPTGGYGNFILPGVLILIIQQSLVLGVGLAAGTARERNNYGFLVPLTRRSRGVGCIVAGKALFYLMVYAVMGSYLTIVVPRLFHFVTLAGWRELLGVLLPFTLASIFFAMTISCLVRYRENVLLLVVFFSVPLLFMSGVSWPQSDIPVFWQSFSWLFPSTFGIRAFVRTNSMGATLNDVATEYVALWIQVAVYGLLACAVYRYQAAVAHRYALGRIRALRRKREVRARFKARAKL